MLIGDHVVDLPSSILEHIGAIYIPSSHAKGLTHFRLVEVAVQKKDMS